MSITGGRRKHLDLLITAIQTDDTEFDTFWCTMGAPRETSRWTWTSPGPKANTLFSTKMGNHETTNR